MAFLFWFLFLFTRKEKGTTLVAPPSVVAFLFHFEKSLAFSVVLCYNGEVRTIREEFGVGILKIKPSVERKR